jgi:hypothetical protein
MLHASVSQRPCPPKYRRSLYRLLRLRLLDQPLTCGNSARWATPDGGHRLLRRIARSSDRQRRALVQRLGLGRQPMLRSPQQPRAHALGGGTPRWPAIHAAQDAMRLRRPAAARPRGVSGRTQPGAPSAPAQGCTELPCERPHERFASASPASSASCRACSARGGGRRTGPHDVAGDVLRQRDLSGDEVSGHDLGVGSGLH